ncbi:sirohydrochlorin cobaltochelatase [Desulfuromusa kysingii]|uniref:Sirohydrochlorin cobaltochelatase n=1 Tax=Desulfuromusa kysingii TaxID=37625 RepID=A0A1H4AI71_9BACT|nr:sirohydrochlorin cobaltochelatase [Desulfuromusa kysingii]SEA35636.1 sirohydrochlorin cobaltochelatase [Desulfuromusa kysingii]
MSMTVSAPATASENTEKPAIVLVAFGTSVDTARPVFDYINDKACERYAGYDVQWAFTSQFIIDKLKKQGIVTRNVEEVVADLRKQGKKNIVFQSLHVVPGQEYRSVVDVDMHGLNVAFGDALMTSAADIAAVVDALGKDIDAQQPTVIVAHGNDHHSEFNQQLVAFAKTIEPQYPNLVVASVEGQPGITPLQKIKVLSEEIGTVKFVPLMIVAGDHIMNDVMGDEEDSWKKIIQADKSVCSQSLGWNDAILEIYFNHLDQAMQTLEEGRG